MSKTLVIIVAVIAFFAVLYIAVPDGLPVTGAKTQLSGLPREGNGLVGRLMDFFAESTWYPAQFFFGFSAFLVVSAGLVFYWKSIQD